ncbi:sulfite oxidase heme-binding subunit YedZ [Thermaurantiacus tibetensis]|uniref:sulfite oxidase heme-binding subunit YedZ n=1 Tax=Thermaurantiacus tibetensis TaxID=2759035 RepID=UPI001F382447|nr:ferric reductase-like transmembrane domain-containing protein [Thermaurantiacus tibetensis]
MPQIPLLRAAAHGVMAMPLVLLLWGWAELLAWNPGSRMLTAEPVAYTHNALGLAALRALLASLSCTPLRRLTGWGGVMALRRLFGLWAFAYGAMHLLFFLFAELDWSLPALAAETAKRPFILAGMVAFLAMAPLAATSTAAAIRWLGARRWQALHRLAYVAGVAACVHFLLRVKGFQWEPWLYLGGLALLLLVRLVPRGRRALRTS